MHHFIKQSPDTFLKFKHAPIICIGFASRVVIDIPHLYVYKHCKMVLYILDFVVGFVSLLCLMEFVCILFARNRLDNCSYPCFSIFSSA